MRGASESPRPRGHPGRGVGAPGRGVQRAVRTGPTARAPRACAPRCGCGTRRPWARLRPTRAPCDAGRTPPPAFHVPERPGAGAGAGAVRRRCAAIRAGPAGGSGPRAHHVQRRLPPRLGCRVAPRCPAGRRDRRRSRRPSRRGSCRPRVRALCRHGAQPLVGRASATALLPVDARACAEVGAGGPTPGPACTACRAAPGPGACRQRRGEGGAVLGRCALAPARVSASRRAGGGSTRR